MIHKVHRVRPDTSRVVILQDYRNGVPVAVTCTYQNGQWIGLTSGANLNDGIPLSEDAIWFESVLPDLRERQEDDMSVVPLRPEASPC